MSQPSNKRGGHLVRGGGGRLRRVWGELDPLVIDGWNDRRLGIYSYLWDTNANESRNGKPKNRQTGNKWYEQDAKGVNLTYISRRTTYLPHRKYDANLPTYIGPLPHREFQVYVALWQGRKVVRLDFDLMVPASVPQHGISGRWL